MDTRYGGQGYVEETGGLSYVSEKYDSNGNSTYSVTFHDVEFTFKYWYYPYGVQDYHYTAYFLIEFQDNTSEIISLATGSYWTTSGIVKRPLFAVTTNHTSPIAGVLSGDYLDNPVCWRFVVSIE